MPWVAVKVGYRWKGVDGLTDLLRDAVKFGKNKGKREESQVVALKIVGGRKALFEVY